MGHDIVGRNNEGTEVSYIRFAMGNGTSYEFYDFYDALEYHAGVSGNAQSATYTTSQIEQALKSYQAIYGEDTDSREQSENDFESYERKEMLTFIKNCLKTAQEEEQ